MTKPRDPTQNSSTYNYICRYMKQRESEKKTLHYAKKKEKKEKELHRT
jgi:hypothetical protein